MAFADERDASCWTSLDPTPKYLGTLRSFFRFVANREMLPKIPPASISNRP